MKNFLISAASSLLIIILIGTGLYYYKPENATEVITDETQTISPTPTTTQTDTNHETASTLKKNLNIGTISIRAIVANIDEVGEKYGSYGMKFTQAKIAEVEQALQRLNTFVKQSSYGTAELKWVTSGVYALGQGVCNHASYGEKVDDLIQRALQKADAETQLPDYSYFLIVHPMPDCPNGEMWSFEGRGQFKEYSLNGRTVHLRGVRISDLSDRYLVHEFGHSLAYEPNTGIGHPDYLSCPLVSNNGEVQINLSSDCKHIFDFNSGNVPIFTIMSTSALSDYNAPEKEIIGWLANSDIVTTTEGEYTLSPIEQVGQAPKALKIPIVGTDYTIYVSFRQPNGYLYPATSTDVPNGVILDITNGSTESFLVTNESDKNAPLKIGTKYVLGINGPTVTVENIIDNLASITVSSN